MNRRRTVFLSLLAIGCALFLSSELTAQNCSVQGIKRIQTDPTLVRFQVQYFIPPTHPRPCFIGAHVPNRAAPNTSFAYRPAGLLPAGVPKGQHHFVDNIIVEVMFNGRTPYASTTIEVSIYDSEGTICSTVINWGQTWGQGGSRPGQPQRLCQVQGIKRVYTSPSKVRFQAQYFIAPDYPRPVFISAYVPNRPHQSGSFRYLPAGRLPNGIPKGQHHFDDNIAFEVEYIGTQPYTSPTIEVVIYDQQGNICSELINWGQTWRREDSH